MFKGRRNIDQVSVRSMKQEPASEESRYRGEVRRTSAAIAFFDMDNTLLGGDNDNLLISHMIRKRQLGIGSFLKMISFNCLFRFGMTSVDEWRRWVLRELGLFNAKELIDFMDEAYELYIMPRLYMEGRDHIAAHKARGHRTVLATGATEYITEKVRVQLGADDKIATVVPFRAGRITDELQDPWPFALGKKAMAERYTQERGLDLKDCYLYSDSIADLPLLEAVGHAVAVNPDKKLEGIALRKGWPIKTWVTPIGCSTPSVPEELTFDVRCHEAGDAEGCIR
jgi:HAD superfamily hydrolase (TIGR01490 family)